jgi:acyl-coenzyme A thioesterase PaaI-like protein
MEILPDHKDSFFVSQDRSDGIKMKMVWDNDEVCSDLRMDARFISEGGTIFAGILFGVMDVLMWCAILVSTGKFCVTRKVNVDFIEPVKPDKLYKAVGRFIRIDGKDVHVKAHIEDGSGNICTTVDAVFREHKEVSLEKAFERLDLTGTSPSVKIFFESLLAGKQGGIEKEKNESEFYPYGLL